MTLACKCIGVELRPDGKLNIRVQVDNGETLTSLPLIVEASDVAKWMPGTLCDLTLGVKGG